METHLCSALAEAHLVLGHKAGGHDCLSGCLSRGGEQRLSSSSAALFFLLLLG